MDRVIDVDEFLFSPTGRSLPDVLRNFENHAGSRGELAGLRAWGLEDSAARPRNRSYLIRSSDDDPVSRTVKSIVQPRLTRPPASHAHIYTPYGSAVGEDGIPPDGPFRASTAELLRINHYRTKSVEEWERKLRKPRATPWGWGPLRTPDPARVSGYTSEHDDIEDRAILPFVPAVKAALSNRVGVTSWSGTDA